jgi:hypothetical protein
VELSAAGLTADTRSLLTPELLGRLDGTFPGFTEWADSLGLEYQ